MKYLYTIITVLLLVRCSEKVTTSPVKRNVQEVVFASGVMEMENEYTISSSGDGIITMLDLKEGDTFGKNQVLAIVDYEIQKNQVEEAKIVLRESKENTLRSSPQLQSLMSQIEQAEVQLGFDKNNYLVYQNLFASGSVSKSEYQKMELQYEASQNSLKGLRENYRDLERSFHQSVLRNELQLNTQKALLKDYTLNSTSSGLVLNLLKKKGELVRKGEAIAIMGEGDFLVKLFISEEDIADIQLNQEVIVSLNTYPDRTFEAKVSKIHPSFDDAEQSYIAEATFYELPDKLFSGTQLQANIQISEKNDILVLPTHFIKSNKVQLESGELRTVEIGFSDDEWAEIRSGINENDIIVK